MFSEVFITNSVRLLAVIGAYEVARNSYSWGFAPIVQDYECFRERDGDIGVIVAMTSLLFLVMVLIGVVIRYRVELVGLREMAASYARSRNVSTANDRHQLGAKGDDAGKG